MFRIKETRESHQSKNRSNSNQKSLEDPHRSSCAFKIAVMIWKGSEEKLWNIVLIITLQLPLFIIALLLQQKTQLLIISNYKVIKFNSSKSTN
jgi:hypothetical protein